MEGRGVHYSAMPLGMARPVVRHPTSKPSALQEGTDDIGLDSSVKRGWFSEVDRTCGWQLDARVPMASTVTSTHPIPLRTNVSTWSSCTLACLLSCEGRPASCRSDAPKLPVVGHSVSGMGRVSLMLFLTFAHGVVCPQRKRKGSSAFRADFSKLRIETNNSRQS